MTNILNDWDGNDQDIPHWDPDDIDTDHVDDDGGIHHWCPICDMWTYVTDDNPYGTCMCS